MNIVPVILSGGAGSRLWPVSRSLHPKPFIRLPDGDTLIAKTYRRALGIGGASHVVTVTNRETLFNTSDEYEAVNKTVGGRSVHNSFILEPVGRDTAAAIALASLTVQASEGEDAIIVTMPADHLIAGNDAFLDAVAKAAALAATGRIVTLGINATRPETGFGYIEASGEDVIRFVEKPDADTARQFVESGRFYWNSGIFSFRPGTMIAAMEKLCPDILTPVRAALADARTSGAECRTLVEIDRENFEAVPARSIDHAVMEKAENIGFVACTFEWSDIGSWQVLSELTAADEDGNRIDGTVVMEGAEGCFVHGEDRLVALVGVSDLLVVDTADALLIARKDQAQNVKTIYERLKSADHDAAALHRKVHRPWGTYTVVEEGPRFKIKRIEVKAGARLSLQSHRHRSEHWVVVSGTAKVVNGQEETVLGANQSTYVPVGQKHRLENPGDEPLVMIEVQCGDYLGEDDIERYDDAYGRS